MPVIAVDKPLGLTSHDVVARARRLRNTRRVGHTGTLDPLATGVVVLCIDQATKIVQFMERDTKDYLAWISLGAATPTLDAEGPITQTAAVTLADDWSECLSQFIGVQQQIPPQYSALQKDGQRAYAVARAGGTLDLPPREITIHSLELLGVYDELSAAPTTFDTYWNPAKEGLTVTLPPALGSFPTLLIRTTVGSGTYIRSLARDIGIALGVPAHLSGLVRTRAGRHSLHEAVNIDDLATVTGTSEKDALDFPILEVSGEVAQQLRQGKRPPSSERGRRTVLCDQQLVAVVDGDGETLRVVRAWNP